MTPLLMGLLLIAAADPCIRAPLRPWRPGEPRPRVGGCEEKKAPLPAAAAESLSPPPVEEAEQQAEGPNDRAALELRAAESVARRARQERLEDERSRGPESDPATRSDRDEQPEGDSAVRAEPTPPPMVSIPPPAPEQSLRPYRPAWQIPGAKLPPRPKPRAKETEWTVGPTGALFLSGGPSGAESSSFIVPTLGGRLGVRFMPESAWAVALSLVGEGATTFFGSEIGLMGRAELIHRLPGRLIPALRLGGFVQPVIRLGPGAGNGFRGGLAFGWCLPVAKEAPAAETPEQGGTAMLGAVGALGGAGLFMLLALGLIASPEVTLGYEVVDTEYGVQSGARLSVGVGF